MLAEFVREIAAFVSAGSHPVSIAPEGDRSRKRLLWNPKLGTQDEFYLPPSKRVATVHTLASLVKSVEILAGIEDDGAIIWISPGRIVAELNGLSDDRDGSRITFDFPLHPAFAALAGLPTKGLDHATFLRWLRSDIGDAEVSPDDVLQRLRVVQWDTLSTSSSESAKDLQKMGREVASMVKGVDTMPDYLDLSFPPFPSLDLVYPESIEQSTICCSLETNVAEARFVLSPIAGQIAKAQGVAQECLSSIVQARMPTVCVLSGAPEGKVGQG